MLIQFENDTDDLSSKNLNFSDEIKISLSNLRLSACIYDLIVHDANFNNILLLPVKSLVIKPPRFFYKLFNNIIAKLVSILMQISFSNPFGMNAPNYIN